MPNQQHGQQGNQQSQAKKAKRKRQAQAASTDYIAAPLTQGQLTRQAKRTARLQTQPIKREIKAEQRASDLQLHRLGDYFDQYKTELGTTGQKVADAYATADQSIAQTGQSTADYAEQLRQKLAAEGRADAATRGATYDTGQDATAAQATVSRLDSSGILQNVTKANAASAADLYANKGTIASREKVEQKLREAARKRTYNQDLKDLATRTGDLTKQAVSDLTKQERDFYLGQQAASLSAKSQRSDAKATRRSQNITSQENAIRDQLAAASQAETHRHNTASEQNTAHGQAVSEANSRRARRAARRADRQQHRQDQRAQQQENRGSVSAAVGLLNSAPKGAYTDTKSAYQYLLSKNVSAADAHAAIRRKNRESAVGQIGGAVGHGTGG